MRHFTTTLFVCYLSSLGAFAQEAVPQGLTGSGKLEARPVAVAGAQGTENMTISDQEFLKIPGEAGQPAQGVLIEQDLSLTGEMPVPAQSDRDFVDPNALMPGQPADISSIDPRSAAPSNEEQDRKLKILYREVRTKAEKEASVVSLREKAESAKTFEAERGAYREYYRALFRRMKQIDKSLATKCDLMEKAYLARLAQTRLEPTIPLEPPPKPEPLAN